MIPMVSSAQSRSRNWCTSPRDRFGFASLDLPRLVLKVFFAVVQIIEKCFCCCGFGCKKNWKKRELRGLYIFHCPLCCRSRCHRIPSLFSLSFISCGFALAKRSVVVILQTAAEKFGSLGPYFVHLSSLP